MEEKKKRSTLIQLAAVALVFVIGLLIVVIPRRDAAASGGASGKKEVSVALVGAERGPLLPLGSGRALGASEAAEALARSVPLAWFSGVEYRVASEALRAEPEVAMALDAMLRAYAAANASYAVPLVTAACAVGVPRDSVLAGGYSLELALLVPSGDEMVEAPLTGAIASGFYAWLISHAPHYGFAVSGSGLLTYVGTPHAAYLFHKGIELSEYVALIREKTRSSPLVVETGGVYYEIFYVRAEKGSATLKLPRDAVFTVSGVGDGFIIALIRD